MELKKISCIFIDLRNSCANVYADIRFGVL